jgi:endoglucanase
VQRAVSPWLVTPLAAAIVVAALLISGFADLGADSPVESSGLRVRGNRILSPTGEHVLLRGVNRMGFEYSCVQGKGVFEEQAGAPIDQASVDGIKSWRANAVRVPLNEHCWLGIGGEPSGAVYQRAIEAYVDLLLANDLYVILDLHWSAGGTRAATGQDPMPNVDHSADFWTSVADRFKGEERVIFDLFNEPVPNINDKGSSDDTARRSWQCWRDGAAGGTCDPLQRNGMSGSQVAGMQSLVDAVRGTGATNVIMLGGIRFANQLWSSSTRNWLTYKPVDPLRKIVAAWHGYNVSRCHTIACLESEVAPIAAQVPIVAGEIGNNECDGAWMKTLLTWLDRKEIGYFAWVWSAWKADDCSFARLILDYDGTPTRYGEFYRAHLAAHTPKPAPSRP